MHVHNSEETDKVHCYGNNKSVKIGEVPCSGRYWTSLFSVPQLTQLLQEHVATSQSDMSHISYSIAILIISL